MNGVSSPLSMAVIFAEILGNVSTIVNAGGEPVERLDRAAIALEKSWNAVEHFIRSSAYMNGIELTAGNVACLKRAWLRADPEGRTFKEKISRIMRGR